HHRLPPEARRSLRKPDRRCGPDDCRRKRDKIFPELFARQTLPVADKEGERRVAPSSARTPQAERPIRFGRKGERRLMKQGILNVMRLTGAFEPFRLANRSKALILTYHRFGESRPD